MSDKGFMGLVAGLIVVFIGAVLIFGGESSSTAFIGDPMQLQTGEQSENGEAVQPADRFKGAGEKGVTLIEYADFECPACFGFFSVLQQIEQFYGDDITIIFRHNPLSSLHPNAVAAHRASEAAANQGKFWEMHDLLFQNQPAWSRQQAGLDLSEAASTFEGYAFDLGLNINQYREDVESEEVFSYIDSHIESGLQLGITGTPTIFLNGEEVNLRTFEEFQVAIDELIAENDGNSEEAPTEDTSEEDAS